MIGLEFENTSYNQLKIDFDTFKGNIDKVRLHEISSKMFEDLYIPIGNSKLYLKNLANIAKIDLKTICINVFDKSNIKSVVLELENFFKNFSFIVKDDHTIICRAPSVTTEYIKNILKVLTLHFENLKIKYRTARNFFKKKIQNVKYLSRDDINACLKNFQKKLDEYALLAEKLFLDKKKTLTIL